MPCIGFGILNTPMVREVTKVADALATASDLIRDSRRQLDLTAPEPPQKTILQRNQR